MKQWKEYISTRYERYLDYAQYQCSQAGMQDQAGDILQEVMLDLLKKDPAKLEKLYEKQKGKYRELDYYILRMIKLNTISPTSPYRYRYRQPHIDANASTGTLEDEDLYIDDDQVNILSEAVIAESDDQEQDNDMQLCERYSVIRDLLTTIDATEKEKQIFSWRFFAHNDLTEWSGNESMSELYGSYKKVNTLVIIALKKKKDTTKGLVTRYRNLANKVRLQYALSLFPALYTQSARYRRWVRKTEFYVNQLRLLK